LKYNKKEFEDTKGIIRIHKSKDRQPMARRKRIKGQTTINKTLHRKLRSKIMNPTKNRVLNVDLKKISVCIRTI